MRIRIAEPDVVQVDPVPGRRNRPLGFRHRWHVQHLPDPLDGAPGGQDVVESVAQRRDRAVSPTPRSTKAADPPRAYCRP